MYAPTGSALVALSCGATGSPFSGVVSLLPSGMNTMAGSLHSHCHSS